MSAPALSEPIDHYRILNHLDNYGNLDLRNKPYKELPSGLVVKGNLNIAKTSIKEIPQGVDIQGSLDASNSQLKKIAKASILKAMPTYLRHKSFDGQQGSKSVDT